MPSEHPTCGGEQKWLHRARSPVVILAGTPGR
jgi:hypothetical protein